MATYEQLFLLEVLVDKVKLLTRALEAFAPECEDEPETPIRIRVKFSDFPCFEITQDLAPVSKERKDSDPLTTPIVFCSGKSCMFPMDPEQLIQDLIKYPMAVSVFKKNPDSPLPEIIGQTKVSLGDYMTNIIKRAAEWSLEEPLSEMIQDTFPLRNALEQDVGIITMLIRLTCFGKTIITKFQIADNKKSFLFKNAKTQDYEFKCKKCMPGQPILRPRLLDEEEGEDEEDEENENKWKRSPYNPAMLSPVSGTDKTQMTEGFQDPCYPEGPPPSSPISPSPPSSSSPKEAHIKTPGFEKHEFQGPGFTASMEIGYPEEVQDNHGSNTKNNQQELVESQSTPVVKKQGNKSKARGKSLDSKKIEIEKGVPLTTRKRKKKTKFHVPQGVPYPGVILGHKYCLNQGPPVPARNGWAWKTTVPFGMTWEDVRGWRPGCYLKQTWQTLKAVEELRKMGKKKKVKRRPVLPDTRKTTVHVHRIKGVYHVTMNPIKGPDDKEDPEPVVYTLDQLEEGSDASEIELDLTVPDPPYPPPPQLKHQAQQFCEEDLPLIQPKPVFVKKKKKKDRSALVTSSGKKRKPGSGKSQGSDKKVKGKKSEKGAVKKDEGKGKQVSGKGVQKKEAGGKAVTVKEKGGANGKQTGKSTKATPAGAKGATTKGAPAAKVAGTGKGAPVAKTVEKKDGGVGAANKQLAQNQQKKKGKGKKKGEDDDDVYPWDEWIMKLKCKNTQSPDD